MADRQTGKSGDKPLLAAAAITLLLGAGVILGVHRSSIPPSANPRIDPVKIQELINQGRLSDHPAEYFEEIPSQ